MTCQDVVRKFAIPEPVRVGERGALFIHEKPKLRMPVEIDEVILDMLRVLVAKLTKQRQPVCFDITSNISNGPTRTISLSTLLNVTQNDAEDAAT
jgi:hypothetical protein